jgi:AraC-like DNA-binding protein
MDPLSIVLSMLKPRSHFSGRFDLGPKQAIQFPVYEGIKCYAVLSGACWLIAAKAKPVWLREGDCFLLTGGKSFTLAADKSARPVKLETLITAWKQGLAAVSKGELVCILAGGHFLLDGNPADLLLGSLPSIVHLHSEEEKSAMRWALERMREELRNQKLGSFLVVQQLAYTMLVQALRVHLSEASREAVGWLYAISDPQLKTAITSIHDNPANPWSVKKLAQQVGMSRSIFALKFKEKVGESPMEYLTRWRMLLAGNRLTSSEEPILSIALSLGYESESAFGKAFKRVMGSSPRRYGRQRVLRIGNAN